MATGSYFSPDRQLIDHRLVHQWLSERSYWARGRSREKVEAAIAGSRVYGMYDTDSDRQLAFARVVTDGATFAWLCDVYVDDDSRGRRLGVRLMEGVLADLAPLGLSRIALMTADAHGLYARFGFAPADPDRWMILQPVALPD